MVERMLRRCPPRVKHLVDAPIQHREMLFDHVPHDLRIDAEILVNELIPHPRDALPGDIGMPPAKVF